MEVFLKGDIMKPQNIISIIALIIFFAATAFATVWTVDNKSGSIADFTQITEAHNAASDGDTIYVYSTSSDYGHVNVYKRLYIIGTGYFLNENPNTQADTRSAICRGFTFYGGSEGSLLTGFEIWDGNQDITINADSIIIKRNMCMGGGASFIVQNNHSNIIITGNYIHNSYSANNTVMSIGINCNNIQINNNFIYSENDKSIQADPSSSIEVWNNVLGGNVEIHNSLFYNNIMMDGTFTGTNSPANINHNIGDADQFGTLYGNQEYVDMTTVFVDSGSVSTDGDWQLRNGSPAIGAGLNGEDCGMFGGTTPYVLSGMPSIPAIYFFVAPSSASGTQGLQVQIKAKSNN